ncbi:hypothetical protein EVAR_53970_1 [Eumeta japonica]|uniref:Uncharacterized protein n=1 Tax=Eumeta variegata TaxID=151549 RepID=A0A4C1Y166_EUMVA|nr:hypothetical protein EVAR_53970_1 [Eumeta japonica]
MDPHLDDPLNLDSAIGVDFGHAEDVVVTEADILGTGHDEGDINMSTDVEFEHTEEQSMLMETEGEEIIDLMSEQFMLASDSNYVHDDQMTGIMTINSNSEQQNILIKPGAMNVQFVPQTSMSSVDFGQDIQVIQPQIITVQNNQQQTNKKNTVQQLATIMPKPVTVNAQDILKQKTVITSKSHPVTKPLAIAPKPMTLIKPNMMGTVMKKMSVSNIQPAPKPGSMIAQIGKQLVVLPPGSARKLKLVQSDDSNQLQHLNNDEKARGRRQSPTPSAATSRHGGNLESVGSNQSSSETVSSESQSAVLTKINPVESQLAGSTRLVTVHHKSVPVSSNTGLTTSLPKRHGNEIVRIVKNKEQLSFMKSPTHKSLPAPTSGYYLFTGNLQVVVSGTQRTQLHPINVPGKGIQYIRLVTNPTNAVTKPLMTTKNQSVINVQPKTIIMSDGKGFGHQCPRRSLQVPSQRSDILPEQTSRDSFTKIGHSSRTNFQGPVDSGLCPRRMCSTVNSSA